MSFIPVNEPLLNGNEKKYVLECLETGWISSEGPFVKKFEESFATYVGARHAVAVSNGTVALDIAIRALGIGPGDEVILPSLTIISCASAIINAGAVPVTVDCDPRTYNMLVSEIEACITPRTKAIMPVHIYGLPVDMAPLLAIAEKYGLKVLEDSAQAHGLTYDGDMCGSLGHVSTFSFYPNKHITTGEGGMVVTNDPGIAEKCRSYRNLCFQEHRRFVHEELGTNARLSNIQAAIGLAQLEKIGEKLERKRHIGRSYDRLLRGLSQVQLPVPTLPYAENLYWVYPLVLKDGHSMHAEQAMDALKRLGVGTRPFFYPIHQQPVLKRMGLFKGVQHPHSENLYHRGFYIPSGLGITDEQIATVAQAVEKVLGTT